MLCNSCRVAARVVCGLAMTTLVISGTVLPCIAQERLPYEPLGLAVGEPRIREKLQENTNLEFIETSLGDVVQYLDDLHNIQIEIDGRALRDIGLDTEVPITRDLRAISLASALRLILSDLDLTYMVRDEVLLITTRRAVQKLPVIRLYDISRLRPDNDLQNFLTFDLPEMIGVPRLEDSPEPHYSILREYLIVCDNAEAHREVQRMLKTMYEAEHFGSDRSSDE